MRVAWASLLGLLALSLPNSQASHVQLQGDHCEMYNLDYLESDGYTVHQQEDLDNGVRTETRFSVRAGVYYTILAGSVCVGCGGDLEDAPGSTNMLMVAIGNPTDGERLHDVYGMRMEMLTVYHTRSYDMEEPMNYALGYWVQDNMMTMVENNFCVEEFTVHEAMQRAECNWDAMMEFVIVRPNDSPMRGMSIMPYMSNYTMVGACGIEEFETRRPLDSYTFNFGGFLDEVLDWDFEESDEISFSTTGFADFDTSMEMYKGFVMDQQGMCKAMGMEAMEFGVEQFQEETSNVLSNTVVHFRQNFVLKTEEIIMTLTISFCVDDMWLSGKSLNDWMQDEDNWVWIMIGGTTNTGMSKDYHTVTVRSNKFGTETKEDWLSEEWRIMYPADGKYYCVHDFSLFEYDSCSVGEVGGEIKLYRPLKTDDLEVVPGESLYFGIATGTQDNYPELPNIPELTIASDEIIVSNITFEWDRKGIEDQGPDGDTYCENGQMIDSDDYCDGHSVDCSDGSDEKYCPGQFLCDNMYQIIPGHWECDDEHHCDDGSDEWDCEGGPGGFYCMIDGDMTEIDQDEFCDWSIDCDGATDEKYCPGRFVCDDLEDIIDDMDRCDGDYDCDDRSDEYYCDNDDYFFCYVSGDMEEFHTDQKCNGDPQCDGAQDEVGCPGQFVCDNGMQVIPEYQKCDDYPHCMDGSDERDCDEPDYFYCDSDGKEIYYYQRCDGYFVDCDDASDERGCDGSFVCDSNDEVHPDYWECDGWDDCDDGSDEWYCFQCQYTVVHPSEVCDGKIDCVYGDWSDEMDCPDPDYFYCDSGEMINAIFRCDGYYINCTDASDEAYCPDSFLCDDKSGVHQGHYECDGWTICPDGSDEWKCHECDNSTQVIKEDSVCDGWRDCDNSGSDEWECGSDYFYCHSGETTEADAECDWSIDCNDASDEKYCDDMRFVCANDMYNRVFGYSNVCDGYWDCSDGSDEWDCYLCMPENFTIHYSEVCDGDWDCYMYGGDESDCDDDDDDYFVCYNGTKIESWAVCNNQSDCMESEDEIYPCMYYMCMSNDVPNLVIYPDYDDICDGKQDCESSGDYFDDEEFCDYFMCKKSGYWIPYGSICDGNYDCMYGEDEEGKTCGKDDDDDDDDYFMCYNGTMIESWAVCDDKSDCMEGEDELYPCMMFMCMSSEEENLVLYPDYDDICDGKQDCESSGDYFDDEEFCDYFMCKKSGYWISYSNICDGNYDCMYGEDEDDKTCGKDDDDDDNDLVMMCDGGATTVTMDKICDRDQDCLDGADEDDCELDEYACMQGGEYKPIDQSKVCDEVIDCDDGLDEAFCGDDDDDDREIMCIQGGDWETIDISNYCDGTQDCDDNSDESSCPDIPEFTCAYMDGDGAETTGSLHEDQMCDGNDDCLNGADEEEANCFIHYQICHPTGDLEDRIEVTWNMFCDGSADCNGGYDEMGCDTAKRQKRQMHEESEVPLCVEKGDDRYMKKQMPSGEWVDMSEHEWSLLCSGASQGGMYDPKHMGEKMMLQKMNSQTWVNDHGLVTEATWFYNFADSSYSLNVTGQICMGSHMEDPVDAVALDASFYLMDRGVRARCKTMMHNMTTTGQVIVEPSDFDDMGSSGNYMYYDESEMDVECKIDLSSFIVFKGLNSICDGNIGIQYSFMKYQDALNDACYDKDCGMEQWLEYVPEMLVMQDTHLSSGNFTRQMVLEPFIHPTIYTPANPMGTTYIAVVNEAVVWGEENHMSNMEVCRDFMESMGEDKMGGVTDGSNTTEVRLLSSGEYLNVTHKYLNGGGDALTFQGQQCVPSHYCTYCDPEDIGAYYLTVLLESQGSNIDQSALVFELPHGSVAAYVTYYYSYYYNQYFEEKKNGICVNYLSYEYDSSCDGSYRVFYQFTAWGQCRSSECQSLFFPGAQIFIKSGMEYDYQSFYSLQDIGYFEVSHTGTGEPPIGGKLGLSGSLLCIIISAFVSFMFY